MTCSLSGMPCRPQGACYRGGGEPGFLTQHPGSGDKRKRVGVSTFRPLDPCSPAGPSGPRGPWNRKKGLSQWTAGVSLGLGTRRAGLPRALSSSLHKQGFPPPLCLPHTLHPHHRDCRSVLSEFVSLLLVSPTRRRAPKFNKWNQFLLR